MANETVPGECKCLTIGEACPVGPLVERTPFHELREQHLSCLFSRLNPFSNARLPPVSVDKSGRLVCDLDPAQWVNAARDMHPNMEALRGTFLAVTEALDALLLRIWLDMRYAQYPISLPAHALFFATWSDTVMPYMEAILRFLLQNPST